MYIFIPLISLLVQVRPERRINILMALLAVGMLFIPCYGNVIYKTMLMT